MRNIFILVCAMCFTGIAQANSLCVDLRLEHESGEMYDYSVQLCKDVTKGQALCMKSRI